MLNIFFSDQATQKDNQNKLSLNLELNTTEETFSNLTSFYVLGTKN